MEQKIVWVLADDKVGHSNQALGVANALDIPYNVQNLKYNFLVSIPNRLKGVSLLGVKNHFSPPWPDVVIAAGRRTAPVARYIKHKSESEGKPCFITQIMWPDCAEAAFDLIAVPEHDNIATMESNIIATVGAPHTTTAAKLVQEANRWERIFADLPTPRIAVMLGGGSKLIDFSINEARQLGTIANQLATESGGSLLITNSRRTDKKITQALKAMITCPHYFYDVHEDKKDNPYHAFLALADYIIVTGDSMSMCSEVCAAGCPVAIFSPEVIPEKHRRMHSSLFQKGYATPLTESTKLEEIVAPPSPLNAADIVAKAIREKLES